MSVQNVGEVIYPSQVGEFCDAAERVSHQVSKELRLNFLCKEVILDVASSAFGYADYQDLLDYAVTEKESDPFKKIGILESYSMLTALASKFIGFYNAHAYTTTNTIVSLVSDCESPKILAMDEFHLFFGGNSDKLIDSQLMLGNKRLKYPSVIIDVSSLTDHRHEVFSSHPLVRNFVNLIKKSKASISIINQAKDYMLNIDMEKEDVVKMHFNLEYTDEVEPETIDLIESFREDMMVLSLTGSFFITSNNEDGHCNPCVNNNTTEVLPRLVEKGLDSLFIEFNKERLILNKDFEELVNFERDK